MAFFPRFIENEFAPMFRLLQAAENHALTNTRAGGSPFANSLRSFQPKFDVRETKDAYELHGELPGIEQRNINVEFTDAQTLTIKGRTEQVREGGKRSAGSIESKPEQAKTTENENSSYHKPTVEDENAPLVASPDAATPAETPSSDTQSIEVTQQQQQQEPPKPQGRYWVSERSVGEFARTFNFPTRVDQDAVKASLKNGILSIVVPKAAAPTSRRINVD